MATANLTSPTTAAVTAATPQDAAAGLTAAIDLLKAAAEKPSDCIRCGRPYGDPAAGGCWFNCGDPALSRTAYASVDSYPSDDPIGDPLRNVPTAVSAGYFMSAAADYNAGAQDYIARRPANVGDSAAYYAGYAAAQQVGVQLPPELADPDPVTIYIDPR